MKLASGLVGQLRTHRYFAFFFGAMFLWFLGPYLLLQKGFVLGDSALQFFPWSFRLAEAIRSASLPYWTDLMACGFPLVAEGQAGPFYLPHWIAYAVLPFEAAYAWSVPAHFLLGGTGFYIFAQRSGLSREASTFGAILFSFSSVYGGCFYNVVTLKTLTWLPWMLCLLGLLAEKRKLSAAWIALLSIVVSLMWCAGFMQLAAYAFLYSIIWILFTSKAVVRTLGAYAFAGVIGTAIAWPQIGASLELAQNSMRWGGDVGQALWGSVHPLAVSSFAYPRWGAVLQTVSFLGTLPLFFILIQRRSSGDTRGRAHLWLALIFFLLAIGKYNPLYAGFIEATGLTFFRNPAKFLFFSIFSLTVLAGIGFEKALGADAAARRRTARAGAVLAVAIAALPVLAFAALSAASDALDRWGVQYAEKVFASKQDPLHDVAYYRERMQTALDYLRTSLNPADFWNLYGGAMAVLAFVLLAAYSRGILSRKVFRVAAPAILCLDLIFLAPTFGSGFMGNSAPMGSVLKESALVARIRGHVEASGGRMVEWASGGALLEPNSNMIHGIPHAGGYTPLLLRRYYELTKDLGIADASFGKPALNPLVWRSQKPILDALSVSVIVSDEPLDWLSLGEAEQAEGRYIYKNRSAQPIYSIRHDWRVLADKEARLAYLKSGRFDPAREAVVESALPTKAVSAPAAATVRIVQDGNMNIVLETQSEAAGVLVATRAFYPRWKARVDGKSAALFPANHALTGLWLEPGSHRVEIYWETARQRRAEILALSLVGLCFLTVAAAFARGRKGRGV